MIKLNKIIFMLPVFLLIWAGCTQESLMDNANGDSTKGKVYFTFSPVNAVVSTRTVIEPGAKLKHLWYAVADSEGNVITPFHQYKAEDLSFVTVEGLKSGRYSVAFLATTDQVTDRFRVEKITHLNENWVSQISPTAPVDQDLLMSKVDFEVDENQSSKQINVDLERVVGRTELKFNFKNPYSVFYIKKVEVNFDQEGYSSFSANKVAGGTSRVEWYDVTKDHGFFAMPFAKSVSGTVRVTSVLTGGQEIVTRYPFTSHQVTAGTIHYIQLNYLHPEDDMGNFNIREIDYNSSNLSTILADDEPKSVYYDRTQRSFYVNKPLQIIINANKELQMRFYSATDIHRVKVWVRFVKHSAEFVELANFETVKAFSECRFKLPVMERECVFRDKNGREVIIPKIDSYADGDFEFKYETDDPYIAKIRQIKTSYLITYHHFGGDPDAADGAPAGNWYGIRPVHIREASVFLTNIAYLFSQDYFRYDVENSTDLKDPVDNDGVTPVDRKTIVDRYLRHSHFNVGLVWTGNGIDGLGGGSTWGVAEGYFIKHYSSAYGAMVMMHEYGHCVGYGHSSGMTYGPFADWVGKYYVDQIQKGILPLCDSSLLNSAKNPNTYRKY